MEAALANAVPADKPEFVWVSPDISPENFDWQERLRHRMRGLLYGERLVKMMPLGGAGTVYTHDEMGWLANGGRHVSALTTVVDDLTRGNLTALATAFAMFVTFMVGLMCLVSCVWSVIHAVMIWRGRYRALSKCIARYGAGFEWACEAKHSLINWWNPIPTSSWGFAVGAFILLTMPYWLSLLMRLATLRSRAPGLFTRFTIHALFKTQLLASNNNPESDIFEIRIADPSRFEVSIVGGFVVCPEGVALAVPTLLLAGNTDETATRATANVMRRANIGAARAKNTVDYARALAQGITTGNGLPAILRNGRKKRPSLLRTTIRWLTLPYVWAFRMILSCVASWRFWVAFGVIATCFLTVGVPIWLA